MSRDADLHTWPTRLRATLEGCRSLRRALVFAELGSTQDAARQIGAGPGDMVIAARQTSGRGTHGRQWVDTADAGLAMTLCLPAERPERLSVLLGVAVARGLLAVGTAGIGLKWPNDVQITGKKIAGILVEQRVEQGVAQANAGIGINVGPFEWPGHLHDRAISLSQAGIDVPRLDVLLSVLKSIDQALDEDDASLITAWHSFDQLTGEPADFRIGSQCISGVVERIDPMHGLSIATAAGPRWLPAHATTRMDHVE